jgi:REP element-mobilizing transposase RayT
VARALRTNYPGAVQHIAVNANNRQSMFADEGDRRLCIALLAQTAVRYEWEVRSYCLMDTHWHAVVCTPLGNLPAGMQRLNTAYSRMFNQRHQRSGHSIRHRYMSVAVEDGLHLMELSRYIPLNPVRAGLTTHPEDWHWSSHRAELGLDPAPIWLETGWLRRLHGSAEAHRRFVAEGMAEPGTHWAPGSDPTINPRQPEAGTAPRRPASA